MKTYKQLDLFDAASTCYCATKPWRFSKHLGYWLCKACWDHNYPNNKPNFKTKNSN